MKASRYLSSSQRTDNHSQLTDSQASGLWFLSLTVCVAAFRHAITPRILRAINVLCGTVLMLYGLHLGYTFVQFFQI